MSLLMADYRYLRRARVGRIRAAVIAICRARRVHGARKAQQERSFLVSNTMVAP